MLKKLNESELRRVAPFIMGEIYEKMAGDSYVYKTEDDFKNEMSQHRGVCWFWRIWPFSLLRWLFYKEKEHPSAPVIIMKPKNLSKNQQAIINKNEALFVLILLEINLKNPSLSSPVYYLGYILYNAYVSIFIVYKRIILIIIIYFRYFFLIFS